MYFNSCCLGAGASPPYQEEIPPLWGCGASPGSAFTLSFCLEDISLILWFVLRPQNGWGWKGPLGVILSNSSAQPGTPRSGGPIDLSTGILVAHPRQHVMFFIVLRIEAFSSPYPVQVGTAVFLILVCCRWALLRNMLKCSLRRSCSCLMPLS